MSDVQDTMMFWVELKSMALQWKTSSVYDVRICGEALEYLIREYKMWDNL